MKNTLHICFINTVLGFEEINACHKRPFSLNKKVTNKKNVGDPCNIKSYKKSISIIWAVGYRNWKSNSTKLSDFQMIISYFFF